tara:strand:+ start:196 stop:327 length:132 start_codon:yes stop_codon:yes gene_type:complete
LFSIYFFLRIPLNAAQAKYILPATDKIDIIPIMIINNVSIFLK